MTKLAYAKWVQEDQARSGIPQRCWANMQIECLTAAETAAVTRGQHKVESYRLPYFANGFYRLRLREGANGQRYWQPPGSGCHLYLPPLADWKRIKKDPSTRLYVTEGEKKGASLLALGVPCIALGGVDSWRKEALDELDEFDLDGREVVLVFDTPDTALNPNVRRALSAFGAELTRRGANVSAKRLPDLRPGGKTGLDDFLVARGLKAFEALELEPVEPPQNNTDLGNARRLVLRHGADLRYCTALGWLAWNGCHWRVDDSGEVMRRAKETAGAIYGEAAREKDPERKRALAKWAIASESVQRLKAAVELARTEPGMHVEADALDADPWLLNVLNGVVELRTGRLRPARREDLITKCAPVAFDQHAKCPTWEAFLDRIMESDAELIAFLQRWSGYTLTGDTAEKGLVFLHGKQGDNGKSTFLETKQTMLGDYSRKVNAEVLMTKQFANPSAASPELVALLGRRLVVASELSDRQRINESFLKDMVGGIDRISGRDLYKGTVNFKPVLKLWLYGNHKPQLRSDDDAAWRRLYLVPFDVRIPKEEQDKALPEKLRAELPGILNWALRGLADYQRLGLRPPAKVVAATAAYRDEQDWFGQFLGECCVQDRRASVPLAALYQSYGAWCRVSQVWAQSKPKFQSVLKERGFNQATGKGNVTFIYGLAFKGGEGKARKF